MSTVTIPFVVIAYNNLTFVKSFVEQIAPLTSEIIILDNCSSFPIQFEYYDVLEKACPVKITIHRLKTNYGHRVYLLRRDLLPNVYILSDPDLLLNPKMPTNVAEILLALSLKYRASRVGLALDISDHEKFVEGPYGQLVYKIESGYYQKQIPDPEYTLYEARLDTTFTLINGNMRTPRHIRVAGDFTCKHLPWYHNWLKENIPKDELLCWMQNNKSSSILKYIDPSK